MFPFIFQSGDFFLPTFSTMVMLGILGITFWLYYHAPKWGFSQVVMIDLGIVGAISGILGARLYHVFVEKWSYYAQDLWRILDFWRGGMVSYGAFIGGTLGIIIYLILRRQNVLKYMDAVATGLPILIFFTRVGCLGAGCCYGKPTDFFFHLVFDNPGSPAGQAGYAGMHLHATQLYEMTYATALFIFINWFYRKVRSFDGQVITMFFMVYPVLRFCVEFLRGDEDRGLFFARTLSAAQVTGLGVFILSFIAYQILKKRSVSES
jgi:phosphatidylglycerol:prolipoprotein diacylglycerol transferase